MKNKKDDFISLELLRKLVQEMKDLDIRRLVVKNNSTTYEIERETAGFVNDDKQIHVTKKPEKDSEPETETKASKDYFAVKTPIVGTFYRAPSKDSDPFVNPGEQVKKGDKLCIVEAMKAMNEIESEVNGIVREILVDNSDPVEYGQTLFLIEEE